MSFNKNTVLFIKNISFLKKFPDNIVNEILSISMIRRIKKDEILFLEGDKATRLFVILSGTFKLFNETFNGHESVVNLLSNGDFFGEQSLSDKPIYSVSAESTKNSQILEIPSQILKQILYSNQKISFILLQELLSSQAKLESQIEYLSVMNAPQRIGWYLINKINNTKDNNEYNRILLQHDKAVIATFLGMKPETFSRAIKKLKEASVHVNGAEIIVKNFDLLYKYCTENSLPNKSSFVDISKSHH